MNRNALPRAYQKWLLNQSEANLIGKLRFQALEWNYVGQLENYVRSGKPLDVHGTVSEKDWELYQEAMRDLSINAARELWQYEVSGKPVMTQWFSCRRKNRERPIIGGWRPPVQARRHPARHWLAEYTTELLSALHVLALLVDWSQPKGAGRSSFD